METNTQERVSVIQNSPQWQRLRAEFVEAQGGNCAICSEPFNDSRRPQLDHCHQSGFVRGALCGSCNVKLGWLENRRQEIESYLALASQYIATDRVSIWEHRFLQSQQFGPRQRRDAYPNGRIPRSERLRRKLERERQKYLARYPTTEHIKAIDSQAAGATQSA